MSKKITAILIDVAMTLTSTFSKFYCTLISCCDDLREAIKNSRPKEKVCVGRESNPDLLLGRQQC